MSSLYFVGDLNILADLRLSANDKLVYFCLVSFMNKKDGKCYPRYATIRKRTGLSERTIQRSIKHLAKLQIVTTKRLSSSNLYLLSRQKILQETIQKRVNSLVGSSDRSSWRLLKKPTYISNNRYKDNKNKSVNKTFSGGWIGNLLHKPTLEYKGETYKEIGTIDHWVEYENKKGERIRKHKFRGVIEKDEDPRKKKFNAAAERQLDCA